MTITELADVTQAASVTFSAPASGDLLVGIARKVQSGGVAPTVPVFWLTALSLGPSTGDSNFVAVHYKVSDGTETSYAPGQMTAASRGLVVYRLQESAAGTWVLAGSGSVVDETLDKTATLALAQSISEAEAGLIATVVPSSSFAAGETVGWSNGFTSDSMHQYTGSTARKIVTTSGTHSTTASWPTSNRRAVGAMAAFAKRSSTLGFPVRARVGGVWKLPPLKARKAGVWV